ncbi:hypothetical protein SNE40_020884 [Patella caerulea]
MKQSRQSSKESSNSDSESSDGERSSSPVDITTEEDEPVGPDPDTQKDTEECFEAIPVGMAIPPGHSPHDKARKPLRYWTLDGICYPTGFRPDTDQASSSSVSPTREPASSKPRADAQTSPIVTDTWHMPINPRAWAEAHPDLGITTCVNAPTLMTETRSRPTVSQTPHIPINPRAWTEAHPDLGINTSVNAPTLMTETRSRPTVSQTPAKSNGAYSVIRGRRQESPINTPQPAPFFTTPVKKSKFLEIQKDGRVTSRRPFSPVDMSTFVYPNDAPLEAQRLLIQFERHVRFADGARRTAEASRQHVKQVFRIWAAISRRSDWDVNNFENPRFVDRLWLMPLREASVDNPNDSSVMKPGTIKSYICSLRLFIEFLHENTKVVNHTSELWANKIRRWNAAMRQSVTRRQMQIRADERDVLLTPDDISKIENAPVYIRVRNMLASMRAGETIVITAAKFRDILAYLLIRLLLDSGQRSMALSNMTMREFLSAHVQSDGIRVVSVVNHKTFYAGHANFPLTEDLYREVETFIDYVRPLGTNTDNSDDARIFSNFTSTQEEPHLNPSMICNIINSRFESLVGKKVSSRLVRKSLVCTILEKAPELSGELAHQMSHSEQTQKRYYSLPLACQRSAAISSTIRDVLRGSVPPRPATPPEHQTTCPTGTHDDDPPAQASSPIDFDDSLGKLVMDFSDEGHAPTDVGQSIPVSLPHADKPVSSEIESEQESDDPVQTGRKQKHAAASKIKRQLTFDAEEPVLLKHPVQTARKQKRAAASKIKRQLAFSSSDEEVAEEPNLLRHPRRSFTEEDAMTLFRIASPILHGTTEPKQTNIKKLIEDDDTPEARGLLKKYSLKQLIDRVRVWIRKEKKNIIKLPKKKK